jgi:hypothetical protein
MEFHASNPTRWFSGGENDFTSSIKRNGVLGA